MYPIALTSCLLIIRASKFSPFILHTNHLTHTIFNSLFVFLSQIYSSLEVFGKKLILYLGTFVNFMWGPDGLEGVKNNVSDYPAKLQNLFVVLWMLWL